jgi:hypothetical protein
MLMMTSKIWPKKKGNYEAKSSMIDSILRGNPPFARGAITAGIHLRTGFRATGGLAGSRVAIYMSGL